MVPRSWRERYAAVPHGDERDRVPSGGSRSWDISASQCGWRGRFVGDGRRCAFSGRCSRLPLVGSSTGMGGWAEGASRPRGRRRSADGRLTVPVAVGSIIESYEGGLGKPVRALPQSAGFSVGR